MGIHARSWTKRNLVPSSVSVGAEVFHQTPKEIGGEPDTRFNVGAVVDFNETHHLLPSGGRGFEGSNLFQGYVAYQLTFGPK